VIFGAPAWVLAALAVVAVVDWWAVATGRRSIEVVAKPATAAVLVILAATAGDVDGGVRAALVVAAVFGLAGDVALLGGGEAAFLSGLGSFAAGHLAYSVAAVAGGVSWVRALAAVPFLAVLLGWRFAGETVPGARRAGGAVLAGAVVGYAAVISAMVLTATGSGSWLAAAGAALFAVSDWVLGLDRFARPWRHARIANIVTYHVGQTLLILGLATA
jgi:uncharacterized membrane protein YhhN